MLSYPSWCLCPQDRETDTEVATEAVALQITQREQVCTPARSQVKITSNGGRQVPQPAPEGQDQGRARIQSSSSLSSGRLATVVLNLMSANNLRDSCAHPISGQRPQEAMIPRRLHPKKARLQIHMQTLHPHLLLETLETGKPKFS